MRVCPEKIQLVLWVWCFCRLLFKFYKLTLQSFGYNQRTLQKSSMPVLQSTNLPVIFWEMAFSDDRRVIPLSCWPGGFTVHAHRNASAVYRRWAHCRVRGVSGLVGHSMSKEGWSWALVTQRLDITKFCCFQFWECFGWENNAVFFSYLIFSCAPWLCAMNSQKARCRVCHRKHPGKFEDAQSN